MLQSMLNLPWSASGVCDMADRVAGIVRNILKLIQTYRNNSHKPHEQQAGDHCILSHSVEILLVVGFSCMVSKFWAFWVCPLILNSHSIRALSACGVSLTISKMYSIPPRCTIRICILHCSYLLILNILVMLHICATFEGYCFQITFHCELACFH